MENLNVKIEKVEGAGNELIIRQGDVLPHYEPVKIKIAGDIKTVANFLSVRRKDGFEHQNVDVNKAIVTVDKNKMTIHLSLNPGSAHNTEVSGKLELSDELIKWGVQQNKIYNLKSLVHQFRFNKLDFDLAEKAKEMEDAYMTFNIKQFIELKQQQPDSKGSIKSVFEKKVDMSLPTQFRLNIPIYKGFPSTSFNVELCLNAKDNGVDFWFESVELHELLISEKERIFNEQLKACEGFVIINQ